MAWGRDSAASRGYGKRWAKLRTVILNRDKRLCQICLGMGRYATAREVDHITPKSQGGTDDPANLQAVCTHCHKVKTGHESRGRDYQSIGCDASGLPRDTAHHWHK